MRVVLLGASGNAGREIARLVSPFLTAEDELVLAGRDAGRLEATAAVVQGPVGCERVSFDADDDDSVRAVVSGARLVVVTVSRPDRIGALARIVAEAGADWLDTLLSSPTKLAALRELEPELQRRGCCFVTDGGFHPGVPAAMVRWAAGRLDRLETAQVVAGMRIDWRADTLADSTITEMLTEFTDFDLSTFVDGTRRRLKWSQCPVIDFGEPIGRQPCVPMPLAEMDALPGQLPDLRECGFFIAGFGPLMDYLALPVVMGLAKVPAWRGAAARLTRWSFSRLASSPPPHRMVIRLAATGSRDGAPASVSLELNGDDGYFLTAAPVVACLRRVLDGTARRPGLSLQALLVDPDTFFDDLTAMGACVVA